VTIARSESQGSTKRLPPPGRRLASYAAVALASAGLVSLPAASHARSVRAVEAAQVWVTDGDVVTVAATPSAVYLGGDFTLIGRPTGAWVRVGADGAVGAIPHAVEGTVGRATSDGAGGWFVGGGVERVGGIERHGLQHLRANGRLDAGWSVKITGGNIVSLARRGTTLYLGAPSPA
jgi:hypothetical protein